MSHSGFSGLVGAVAGMCLVVFPVVAQANDYYVDRNHPQASDSNVGTETSPWATIGRAKSTLQPGDTVWVKAGTYKESIRLDATNSQSGTASNPITYQAHSRRQAIISEGGYGFRLDDLQHVTVRGFVIEKAYNQGIYVSDSRNITIRDNEVRDISHECVRFTFTQNSTARDNRIHDCGTGGNGEGIYVGTDASQTTDTTTGFIEIKDNEIYATGDEPVEVKGGAHDVTIDGNRVHDSRFRDGGGIKLHAYPGIPSRNPNHVVRNNTIYNVSTRTSYRDGNCIAAGTGARIYNNLCYNAQHHGIRVDDWSGDGFPVLIYHNTLYNTGSEAVGVYRSSGGHVSVANNIGPTEPGNISAQSSFFLDASGKNFHLRDGAQPIDAGSNLNISTDLDGKSRPMGGAPDYGAYEYRGNVPPPPAPPTGVRIVTGQ